MDEDIYSPSVDEFHQAFIAFIQVVGAIAYMRGLEFGPQRMGYIAKKLAAEFADRFNNEEAATSMTVLAEDSKSAAGALFEEFVYIATKYRHVAENVGIELTIPGNVGLYEREEGNPFNDEAVKDITTVKGSVDKLLQKLPKWAQRLLEVLLEALKLTRGG